MSEYEIPENERPAETKVEQPAQPNNGSTYSYDFPFGDRDARRREWHEQRDAWRQERHDRHAVWRHERHEWRQTHRDPVDTLFWAALLIMAGVVFMASNVGVLPQYGGADVWNWLALGAGALLLLASLIRAVMPDVAGPDLFGFIVGFVLIGIGAGPVFNFRLDWSTMWPLILIVLGLLSVSRALRHG
jgi:hypothetical protein